MISNSLNVFLVCPVCHGSLVFTDSTIFCKGCSLDYPVKNNIPILFAPASPFYESKDLTESPIPTRRPRSGFRKILGRIIQFDPPLTTWINRNLFQHLNACTGAMRILNLGSGVGLFDDNIKSNLNLINLDVNLSEKVDLLADAHWFPFADESIDAVFSNAVLEHVQRPWLVAEEIYRILRPGGRVFINVPFLNVIHDKHDYFRFTDRGLDILFSKFKKIEGGISAGPSSFLGPFLVEYLSYFIPGRKTKKICRPVIRLFAWPLKYLDFFISRSKNLRLTADAFYFIGEK